MLDALKIFAVDYNYDYTVTTTSADEGSWGAFFGVWMVIWLVLAAVTIAGMWKIFVKAGRPGWAALIPIYNVLQLLWTVGRPWWWILLFALSVIPFVGWIVAVVVGFIVSYDLAKSFNKDMGWAILLLFLPFVGYPMLGFGDAKYKGPSALEGGSSGQSSAAKKS